MYNSLSSLKNVPEHGLIFLINSLAQTIFFFNISLFAVEIKLIKTFNLLTNYS